MVAHLIRRRKKQYPTASHARKSEWKGRASWIDPGSGLHHASRMSLFVKICGLANEADVRAAVEAKPDAIGFVFHPPSPRCVTPAEVRTWTQQLPSHLLKVGVFVNEPPERVAALAQAAGLDIAQLHGEESPAQAAQSWPRTWKTLKNDARLDEETVTPWPVEAFLLDTPGGVLRGGTGVAGDWTRAAAFVQNAQLPVLLAGGLKVSTVAQAVRQVHPWGVDVSSGVEKSPGIKDAAAMKEFVELCRSL